MKTELIELLVKIIGGIALVFLLFMALRGLYLWYFRINEVVELLKEQNKSLQQIAFMMSANQIKESKTSEKKTLT